MRRGFCVSGRKCREQVSEVTRHYVWVAHLVDPPGRAEGNWHACDNVVKQLPRYRRTRAYPSAIGDSRFSPEQCSGPPDTPHRSPHAWKMHRYEPLRHRWPTSPQVGRRASPRAKVRGGQEERPFARAAVHSVIAMELHWYNACYCLGSGDLQQVVDCSSLTKLWDKEDGAAASKTAVPISKAL